ncbi:alginate export family protein [Pseudomonas denitrificans (nom. rej.)]|uniref:Alginate export domain-containing protein n=1 Tax=Pseudomonas denitrificans TaxID=43306 RepID=A0A9X7N1X3_PSEDE|nr:alginate export family protein [Pseudomonas denitrificans (nom. rej.)]QEY73425.1 hypothetical protein F1C79_18440 [Pseudomonas denitrificans (nom. rej.)]
MNNQNLGSLSTLLLASLTSLAHADSHYENGDLQADFSLSSGATFIDSHNVNFGAGQRDYRSGEVKGERAVWQEAFLKPEASFRYTLDQDLRLVGGASLVAAHTFGDGDAGGYTRNSDGKTSLEELYAGIERGPWRLTLGNQNFRVGTGFILADGNLDLLGEGAYWSGPRTAFRDGAILAYRGGALSGQAFSVRNDDDLGGARFSGANLDYPFLRGQLGLMALKVSDVGSQTNQIAPRNGMQVYNLRWLDGGFEALPELSISAEYGLQTGEGEQVSFSGHAWYVRLDYGFADLPLQPKLTYRYALFSGDDDPSDDRRKSWDPLSKAYTERGSWVIGDVVGNYLLNDSNERVHMWRLAGQVAPGLSAGTVYYQFSLDEENYYGQPVSDRRFADEAAVYLDWAASSQLFATLSYNWVKPKAAAREVFGNDTFDALQLYVGYRF